MSRAVKCPVCNGTGRVKDNRGTLITEKICPGCHGTGWIEIEKHVEPVDIFPKPFPQRPYSIPSRLKQYPRIPLYFDRRKHWWC